MFKQMSCIYAQYTYISLDKSGALLFIKLCEYLPLQIFEKRDRPVDRDRDKSL